MDNHTSWSSETWCCFEFNLLLQWPLQFNTVLSSSDFCLLSSVWLDKSDGVKQMMRWMRLDEWSLRSWCLLLSNQYFNFRVFNPNQTEHLSIQERESWDLRWMCSWGEVLRWSVVEDEWWWWGVDEMMSGWFRWWMDELIRDKRSSPQSPLCPCALHSNYTPYSNSSPNFQSSPPPVTHKTSPSTTLFYDKLSKILYQHPNKCNNWNLRRNLHYRSIFQLHRLFTSTTKP